MDEKRNETLDQRRKAQRDFLELKKMQSGQVAPPPKPSEESVEPKTAGEKAKNFWFYYRWHVIAGIFAAAVLAVLIAQCAGREKYDSQIVLFTYDAYFDAQTAAMGDYFEKFCTDYDGNGEINVGVTSCSYSKNEYANTEYNNTMATKLQSILVAQREIVLFIVDSESFEYMNALPDDDELFLETKVTLGEDFYAACDIYEEAPLPEGLMLVCRFYPEETLGGTDKVSVSHKNALEIMEKIKSRTAE